MAREGEREAKERSGTREGLAWSGIGGGQESEGDALWRNPCVISCVCPKPPAPRPRHLVPLLGELDCSCHKNKTKTKNKKRKEMNNKGPATLQQCAINDLT